MNDIRPGVIVTTEFNTPGSKYYADYISYMDREEAISSDEIETYDNYLEYMDNPNKEGALFTKDKDVLTYIEKQQLKETYQLAQDNNSLLWKTVISFDNSWLEQNGIYNSKSKALDASKLREITRICMDKMLEKEGIGESSIWTASIHFNTDNLHVHIGTTEPYSVRPTITYRGRTEYRGVFKQSSIEAGKSAVVNRILNQQIENQLINEIIRNDIVASKKEKTIHNDDKLKDLFFDVYDSLPANKQYWNYNSKHLNSSVRNKIDTLSKYYIEQYNASEFKELEQLLEVQEEKYTRAYGSGSVNNYHDNKIKDLYVRLGNAMILEFKEYDKQIHRTPNQSEVPKMKHKESITNKNKSQPNTKRKYYRFKQNSQKNINSRNSVSYAVNRTINAMNQQVKSNIESSKNQAKYNQMQREQEYE